MRPLKPDDLVRGQYAGYRHEPGVAKRSDVETFCALRLFIDSWRWQGVPWYLRSGKYLAETATEVLVELKPPPQRLFADSAPAAGANQLSALSAFPRIPPLPSPLGSSAQARSSSATSENSTWLTSNRERKRPTSGFWEMPWPATATLFTREDAVEAAWAVVDPVLKTHHRASPYKRGSWGPKEADALIEADGGWHNPMAGCAGGQEGRQKENVYCRYRRDRLDQRECISRYDSFTPHPQQRHAGIHDAKNKKESIMTAKRNILARVPRNSSHAFRILAIDIGGSHLKAALIDAHGRMLTKKMTVKTPKVLSAQGHGRYAGGARQAASVPQPHCDRVSRRRARRPCVDSAPLGHEGMG